MTPGMNISILRLPWLGGRDPQLMSNDWRPASKSADVQCEFIGVEWKLGGGGR